MLTAIWSHHTEACVSWPLVSSRAKQLQTLSAGARYGLNVIGQGQARAWIFVQCRALPQTSTLKRLKAMSTEDWSGTQITSSVAHKGLRPKGQIMQSEWISYWHVINMLLHFETCCWYCCLQTQDTNFIWLHSLKCICFIYFNFNILFVIIFCLNTIYVWCI